MVFDFSNTANMTIDGIRVEQMVCLYCGANTDDSTLRNSQIRKMLANGINMTERVNRQQRRPGHRR